jgi:hypothetical protein
MSGDHNMNQKPPVKSYCGGKPNYCKPTELDMSCKISGDGKACVDHDYYWRPLDTAPHGVKVQLLSIYGVAAHGLLSPAIIEEGFWIGWTPLPKRRKEND